jgi:tRNA1(Val) A37 N6-methylase TrmN6
MALIFPRVARNFIKNGYFPTDECTLQRICSAIDAGDTSVRILDPCCGEGAALQVIEQHLSQCGANVLSHGIEIDEERAWHAKSVLATVAHADVHDVVVSPRSMGLLFLNPPYGDLIADAAVTGDKAAGRQRHEKLFCQRCFNLLRPAGILVLVVPFSVLDAELSTLIARHFERVQVFMAPEQQFRQCVLFGVKRRPQSPAAAAVEHLVTFSRGEHQRELPDVWADEPYQVPGLAAGEPFSFTVVRLDARQLGDELQRGLVRSSLWPRLDTLLRPRAGDVRRPLRALSDWHLALALAAGQICGIVRSTDGRRLLIKGATHKAKDRHIETEVASDGSVSQTQVLTDKFVTVIRGIDVSDGPSRGQVVTIR